MGDMFESVLLRCFEGCLRFCMVVFRFLLLFFFFFFGGGDGLRTSEIFFAYLWPY